MDLGRHKIGCILGSGRWIERVEGSERLCKDSNDVGRANRGAQPGELSADQHILLFFKAGSTQKDGARVFGRLNSYGVHFCERDSAEFVDMADLVGLDCVDGEILQLLEECINDSGFVRVNDSLGVAGATGQRHGNDRTILTYRRRNEILSP